MRYGVVCELSKTSLDSFLPDGFEKLRSYLERGDFDGQKHRQPSPISKIDFADFAICPPGEHGAGNRGPFQTALSIARANSNPEIDRRFTQ